MLGIIYQNKKILICQRKEEGRSSLKMGISGGKLKDLKIIRGFKRELKEELNMKLMKYFFDEYLYEYKKLSKNLKLVFFKFFNLRVKYKTKFINN